MVSSGVNLAVLGAQGCCTDNRAVPLHLGMLALRVLVGCACWKMQSAIMHCITSLSQERPEAFKLVEPVAASGIG
jgi:hypothetical protein